MQGNTGQAQQAPMNMACVIFSLCFLRHGLFGDFCTAGIHTVSFIRHVFYLRQIDIEPDRGLFRFDFERHQSFPWPLSLRQYLTQSGLKESTVPAKLVTGFSLRCDQPAFMLLSLELPVGILFSPGGALLLIAMLAERIFPASAAIDS